MIALVLAAALGLQPLSVADPKLTPGVVRPITIEQVCTTKWGKDHRAVTEGMKLQVFKRYGLSGNQDPRCTPDRNGRRCEVDHRISREIGGADDILNLSPQPYGGPWGASDKDRVENELHRRVCLPATDPAFMSLTAAQHALSGDWTVLYRRWFGIPASASGP